mmetsp:Transcript_1261/g.3506  ORF Transcript_1261/g.3506 Transcript_1261/m.3506 type:complete len:334 (+) Transcript_1261:191-1192(+)
MPPCHQSCHQASQARLPPVEEVLEGGLLLGLCRLGARLDGRRLALHLAADGGVGLRRGLQVGHRVVPVALGRQRAPAPEQRLGVGRLDLQRLVAVMHRGHGVPQRVRAQRQVERHSHLVARHARHLVVVLPVARGVHEARDALVARARVRVLAAPHQLVGLGLDALHQREPLLEAHHLPVAFFIKPHQLHLPLAPVTRRKAGRRVCTIAVRVPAGRAPHARHLARHHELHRHLQPLGRLPAPRVQLNRCGRALLAAGWRGPGVRIPCLLLRRLLLAGMRPAGPPSVKCPRSRHAPTQPPRARVVPDGGVFQRAVDGELAVAVPQPPLEHLPHA